MCRWTRATEGYLPKMQQVYGVPLIKTLASEIEVEGLRDNDMD